MSLLGIKFDVHFDKALGNFPGFAFQVEGSKA